MRIVLIIMLSVVYAIVGQPGFLLAVTTPPMVSALSYHFFHANIFHLAANCLSIWLMFKPVPWRSTTKMARQLGLAFIIATLTYFTATRPVIGVSNILFAIAGMRTPAFNNPWWKQTNTKIFFGITLAMFFVPQFSALTHIISFICGVGISALRRKIQSLEYDSRHAVGK